MFKIIISLSLLLFLAQITFAQQTSKNIQVVNGELGAKIDSRMQELAAKGFSGVLFIAKDGRVVLDKGYGLANREKQISYSPETIFDIGSITKQFTGAAILKLEMQGKLSTNDRISKYFKDVPADKADITLHQLLTHTAGFTDVLGGDYEKLTREELIQQAFASKLIFKPGDRYEYSNLGYSLLGAIVEIVSGKSFEQYLHDNLFKPAGMRETGYSIPKWKLENLAVGYKEEGSRWGTPLDKLWDKNEPFWNLRANGGILSSVNDLYKWHQALMGEKILSSEAKKKYYTPYVPEQPEKISYYSYGWVIQKTRRGTNSIWHNGGNEVFFADFHRFVDENTVVIVATNTQKKELMRDLINVFNSIFTTDKANNASGSK